MRFELHFDLAKLAFFVVGAYLVLQASVRRWRPGWAPDLARRRPAVLGLLTLAMSAIKVIEDVVAQESGSIDTTVLWTVHEQMPAALHGFFAALTLSGSAELLLPAAVLGVHWPTDVLAALSLGVFIPLAFSAGLDRGVASPS